MKSIEQEFQKWMNDLYQKLKEVKMDMGSKNEFINHLNNPINEIIAKIQEPDQISKKLLQEINKIGNT